MWGKCCYLLVISKRWETKEVDAQLPYVKKEEELKIAIITGTGKGIGKAIGIGLVSCGYKVIGLTRSWSKNEIFDNYICDITKPAEIRRVLKSIVKKYGGIDILINNAGIIKFKLIEKYTEQDYQDMFRVNVEGTFFITKATILIMKKQKSGYIINIGSTRAITAAPNKSLYSMSKFAIRALTQSINSEYNSCGIKSTIICPGIVNTESSKVVLKKLKMDAMLAVQKSDIVKTVIYLLQLPKKLVVPEMILGGKL